MKIIRPLDPHLINQISAGEVVERPASVLKELMENALDAQPTHITLRWRQGGQSLLEVEDNGWGIPADQMRLALARHATSKLRTQEDLQCLETFGFRGEALASMASVARLRLISKHEQEDHAWSLSVHGGEEVEFMPANRLKGTAVSVRDLFFATPARLKFMRSAALEQQHLWDVVHKALLAHPDISFSVHSDTRSMEYGTGIEQRLQDVFGTTFGENSFYVEEHRGDAYGLHGWIGLPTYHRATGDRQFYFINRRSVKDKILAGAFRMAFGDTMPKHRHPLGALFLRAPLSEVDVNVHPAKTEVRFLDTRLVRSFVLEVLKDGVWRNGLRAASWCQGPASPPVPSVDSFPEPTTAPSFEGTPPSSLEAGPSSKRSYHPLRTPLDSPWGTQETHSLAQVPAQRNEASAKEYETTYLGKTWEPPHHLSRSSQALPSPVVYDPTLAREDSFFLPKSSFLKDASPTPTHPGKGSRPLMPGDHPWDSSWALKKNSEETIFVDLGQAVMQIQDSYIIARSAAGLVLVDPHAAHERIVYEHMKTQWAKGVGNLLTFLLPISWSLTATEYDHMENLQENMKTLGFDYDLSVQGRCELKTIPMIFQAYDPESLLRDAMACIREKDGVEEIILTWRNHMMANWACRQSLKLGQSMSLEGMNRLLRILERTPHGAQCNHGRCVYRILGVKELARMFDR